MATSDALNVASDLVQHFKLDAECHGTFTHVFTRVKGQRGSKKRETWTRTKAVGQGAFGMVWLEKREGDGPEEVRAVKELRKEAFGRRGTYLDYAQELFAMAKLTRDADHFSEFYGWYENSSQVFLAMEYFELGDLGSYVANPLPEHEVRDITFQLLSGLELIHRYGLVHRDLKPQNVFVVQKSPNWWVKIGDFGISKKVTETTLVTVVGTGPYMAPEILDNDESDGYSYAVDMWSIGCLIYLLVTSRVPFEKSRDIRLFVQGTLSFPLVDLEQHKASPQLCDFLMALLAPDPNNRPSAHMALEMFWVTQRSQQTSDNKKVHPADLPAAWTALSSEWTRDSSSELSKWIKAAMPQLVTSYFTSIWEVIHQMTITVVDMQKTVMASEQNVQQSLAEARKERSLLKDRVRVAEEQLQTEIQRSRAKDEEVIQLKKRMTALEQAFETKAQRFPEQYLGMQASVRGSAESRYPRNETNFTVRQMAEIREQLRVMDLQCLEKMRAFQPAEGLGQIDSSQFQQDMHGKWQPLHSDRAGYALYADSASHNEHHLDDLEGVVQPAMTRIL